MKFLKSFAKVMLIIIILMAIYKAFGGDIGMIFSSLMNVIVSIIDAGATALSPFVGDVVNG